MIAKYVLTLSLLNVALFLNAQTNYKEGSFVTNEGVMMKGFINYREWHKNPDRIQFKRDLESSDVHTLTVDSIRGFSITGYESYTKYIIPVSMDEINFEKLKETIDTTTVTKAILLKEVIKGDRIDLFSYTDEIKVRYFILDKRQSLPYELVYRKILKNGQEITQALFRQQLSGIAHHFALLTPSLDDRISKAGYSGRDIKNIVTRINSQNENTAPSKKNNKKKLNFFVGTGIAMSSVNYKGKTLLLSDGLDNMGRFKFKDKVTTHSYLPLISAGADFYINPEIRKLIIRAELSATSIKSTIRSYYKFNTLSDEEENTYRYSSLNIGLSPQLILNIYNTSKIKCYAGAGFLLSYITNNKNSLERRYSQSGELIATDNKYFLFKEFEMSAIIRSGIRLNDQLDFSLQWTSPVEYSLTVPQSIKTSILSFSVLYFLRK